MAALLRQGARRIGGSVVQRTQAAVTSPALADERRRLMPRRMTTVTRPNEKEVLKMKEELYEALSKGENKRDRGLLQDLAVHVNRRPEDPQWMRLRASKWATNVVRVVANVSFATTAVIFLDTLATNIKRSLAGKREIPLKN